MGIKKDQQEIYYEMVRSFIENVRNYVNGTKGTDWKKYSPYPEFLDEIEGIEDELNSMIGLIPIDDALKDKSEGGKNGS